MWPDKPTTDLPPRFCEVRLEAGWHEHRVGPLLPDIVEVTGGQGNKRVRVQEGHNAGGPIGDFLDRVSQAVDGEGEYDADRDLVFDVPVNVPSDMSTSSNLAIATICCSCVLPFGGAGAQSGLLAISFSDDGKIILTTMMLLLVNEKISRVNGALANGGVRDGAH